jgi:hypothetical protein
MIGADAAGTASLTLPLRGRVARVCERGGVNRKHYLKIIYRTTANYTPVKRMWRRAKA